jgi:hypothetical protein
VAKVLSGDVCLNATKDKAVDCNSEEAAYFLGAKGTPISDEDAARLGVSDVEDAPNNHRGQHLMTLAPADTVNTDETLFTDQSEAGKAAREAARAMPGHEKQQAVARPTEEEEKAAAANRQRQAENAERRK